MLPRRFRITELGKVQGIEDLTIEMVDEEGPAEQAWLHIPVPRRKFHSPLGELGLARHGVDGLQLCLFFEKVMLRRQGCLVRAVTELAP